MLGNPLPLFSLDFTGAFLYNLNDEKCTFYHLLVIEKTWDGSERRD